MTKNKTTKRALLVSVLALLLCASLLVGSTFAWFTDNVTSTNNIIKSGNLDVKLEYSTTMEDGSWNEVGANTDIFKNEDGTTDLWEPGFTEVVYLKVSNVGSLALKYALEVTVADEKQGTNQAGEKFYLSQYIKYDVVKYTADKPYENRDAAVAAVPNAVALKTGIPAISNVSLEPKTANTIDSDVLALVVYMPTTVGNVANHNGEDIPTINLGITLNATQLAYEEDSFGPDYDEDAVYADSTYVIDGAKSLADTLADIEASDDEIVLIELDKDVTWETGSGHGSTPWLTENAKVKTLIVDGNGYTITATGAGVGSIRMANGGTLVIKDAKIVDKSVSYAEGSWEFTYLEFAGKLAFDNVTFLNGIQLDTDNGSAPETVATFTNCTFKTEESSVYGAWIGNGTVTFTGCTFTGTRGLKVAEIYGTNIDSVVVDGCTFVDISKKPGIAIGSIYQEGETGSYGNVTWIDESNTTITVKNSKFFNCQKYDTECPSGTDGIYESDTVAGAWLVLENNVAYADAKFVGTASEFLALGGKSLEGVIILTADIDLNGAVVPTIGAAYGKELVVLGNGHTISNGTTAHTNHNGMKHHGLFYAYTDSTLTISDLVIDNVDIDATADTERNYGAAIVVAYADGGSNVTLKNVDVKNCDVKNNTPDIGDEAAVYVGYQTGTLTMSDCDSTGCTVAGETAEKTGAFIGMVNGTATLTNCTTDLTIGTCNRVAGTLTEN